jgi:hypothetical protein
MQLHIYIALVLAAALTASCEKTQPNYCPTAPDHNCLELDADLSCKADQDCSGARPVCDLQGPRICVQCTTNEPAACTGTSPVCGADNTCHGCTAHTQCASNVCLPDGSCAADTSVAYVAPTGADGTCSKSAPCKTLDAALQQKRPYVKIATGLVKDTKTTTIDGQTVTILADPGAQLDRDGDGPVLAVSGADAAVQIYDLEVTGATGAPGGDGIQLTANGDNPSLGLTRVTIDGNQGNGITASGGTLAVSQSTITNNQAVGINSSGGTLTVLRSIVSINQSGGIIMAGSGTVFTITNNFIYRNGNDLTASAGGLSLLPTGTSSMEFNTIVDNQAKVAITSAGGVFCDQQGFTAAHNLIFRNGGGTNGNVQTVGACTYGDSFIAPGANNVDNAPGFAHPNALPFDYHLTATSPKTIVDAAGPCTGVDFDGDPRPIGPACDLGADERNP